MLYYTNYLTHDFWTRTGGWEFDRSHGVGTSSPSHWQAPKPVGWMMCFLRMTLVSVIGRIYTYNGSVIQYWRSCTQSRSIGLFFLGSARFLGWMLLFCFLWFTNCVLLFDKSLILGCLWPLVFILNNTLILGVWCSTIHHLPGCFVPGPFFRIWDSTRC